jgi:hypothetical protein
MRRVLSAIDVALGALLFLSGFLHNLIVLRLFGQTVTLDDLWFITGGLLMNTLGALNLARAWHGADGAVLRWLCLYCNLALFAWFIVFAFNFGTTFPYQAIIFSIVMLLLTFFSLLSLRAPSTLIAPRSAAE